jgi:hypothetical protein
LGNSVFSQVEEFTQMQYRILLSLIAIPALAGSMLTMVLMSSMASASEAMRTTAQTNAKVSATQPVSCDLPTTSRLKSSVKRHATKGILVASSVKIPEENPILDFSEAESDAAVALFGCDCSSCMRALRQLRAQPLLNNAQGHCWSSLQERVSPQEMKEVLQTLDTEETN